MDARVVSIIHAYSRAGLWCSLAALCDTLIKKQGKKPMLVFWRAAGILAQGHVPDAAIGLAETLLAKPPSAFAGAVLVYAAQQSRDSPDHDVLANVELKMAEYMSSASAAALCMVARWLCVAAGMADALPVDLPSAKELAEMAAAREKSPEVLATAGWATLQAALKDADNGKQLVQDATHYFQQAQERHGAGPGAAGGAPPFVDAMVGAAASAACAGDMATAHSTLGEAAAGATWFSAGVAEAAKMAMRVGEWEQAAEHVQRLLDGDAQDVEALRLEVLLELLWRGRPGVAATRLDELYDALERHEPDNAALYAQSAYVCARAGAGDAGVLAKTLKLAQRAQKLSPGDARWPCEVAWQQARLGHLQDAADAFQLAASVNEASLDAVAGMIYVQLRQGDVEDAAAQLEMFHMVQASLGRSAELALLDALLAWRQHRSLQDHLRALSETQGRHWASFSGKQVPGLAAPPAMPATGALAGHGLASGPLDALQWVAAFNPTFCMELAAEYLLHGEAGASISVDGSRAGALPAGASLAVMAGVTLLKRVTRALPGLLPAYLAMARGWMAAQEHTEAERVIVVALEKDANNAAAHLAMATLMAEQGDFRAAKASLDQAKAIDFSMRRQPGFLLAAGRVALAQQDAAGAVAALSKARDWLEEHDEDGGVSLLAAAPAGVSKLSLHDKAMVYTCLAKALAQHGQPDEATDVLAAASTELAGTPEEAALVLTQATISLSRDDVDGALALLSAVPESSPAFGPAALLRGNVLLSRRRDRAGYLHAVQSIVDAQPTAANFVALGEAHMRLGDAEPALEALKRAAAIDPADPAVAARVGRAMVTLHDYSAAVEFYIDALSAAKARRDVTARAAESSSAALSSSVMSLRADLTKLYMRLRRFQEAEELLQELGREGHASPDAAGLTAMREALQVLARVHKSRGNMDKATVALERALSLQADIIAKLRASAPELLPAQRDASVQLSLDLAELALAGTPPDTERALQRYDDALGHKPKDAGIMLAIAQTHLRRGDTDAAQAAAEKLRAAHPDHLAAREMLADLLFAKEEADAALFHFSQLLDLAPRQWSALARLITLLKRSGRLAETKRFLRAAERAAPGAAVESGYKYCSGLYHWYANEPAEAIECLNAARHSGEWGVRAVEIMVRIYCAPDGDALWTVHVDEQGSNAAGGGEEGALDPATAASVAQRLLDNIPRKHRTVYHDVLAAYIAMSRRTPEAVAGAIEQLTGILSRAPDYVPGLLALATAQMMLQATPKARNALKRIVKLPYNASQWQEYVDAWLMLADIFIASGKFDHASELAKRALTYDASCARAWEYLGMISEREGAYMDAADMYNKAWTFSGEAAAPVGYKLAFNHLKAGNAVGALEIGQTVLSTFAEYAAVRTEVLDKAVQMLRP